MKLLFPSLAVILLFIVGVVKSKPSSVLCDPSEYLSHSSSASFTTDVTGSSKRSSGGRTRGRLTCLPCSTCPANQIVRRPCSRLSDTVCGPFYDFEFLNKQPSQQSLMKTVPPSAADEELDSLRNNLGRVRLRGWHGWRFSSSSEDTSHIMYVSPAANAVNLATPTRGEF